MAFLGILITTVGNLFVSVGSSLNGALGSAGVGANQAATSLLGVLGIKPF